jgi:hypothetical protein
MPFVTLLSEDTVYMDKFKQFCLSEIVTSGELNDSYFFDLSLGFFLALGCSIDQAKRLSLYARFDACY